MLDVKMSNICINEYILVISDAKSIARSKNAAIIGHNLSKK